MVPLSILDLAAVGREESIAEGFAAETGADELITVHYSDSVPNRLRSVELTAPSQ